MNMGYCKQFHQFKLSFITTTVCLGLLCEYRQPGRGGGCSSGGANFFAELSKNSQEVSISNKYTLQTSRLLDYQG